ncbi:MFS transporter [Streptomyces sp. NPDC050560]|uniref:MFS transporter n=1 Tax=Streptomyces sp. NPDC050560 TaxID=3365630 RepID=UPI0037AFA1B7
MTTTAPAGHDTAPPGPPLRAIREFRLLWIGQALSDFGSAMTFLVLPLVLLQAGYSAAAAGTIGTATLLTAMVVRVPAGYATDRFDARRLMLACDLVRFVLIGAVAAWTVLGRLPIALAVLAVIVAQVAMEVFRPSQNATVRRVVPKSRLATAISANQARAYAADIAAPAAAGALLALAPAVPFTVDAATFAVSAVCVALLPATGRAGRGPKARPAPPAAPGTSPEAAPGEPPQASPGGAGEGAPSGPLGPTGATTGDGKPDTTGGGRPGAAGDGRPGATDNGSGKQTAAGSGEPAAPGGGRPVDHGGFLLRLTAGLRYLARDRFMRLCAVYFALVNLVFQALVYAIVLGVGSGHGGGAVGAAMSSAAVTGLAGSLIAPWMQRRMSLTAILVIGPGAGCLLLAAAWATGSTVALVAAFCALCLFTPVTGAVFATVMATTVPEEIYGRALTASGFASEVLQPLGPLAAGLLLATLSLPTIAAVFALGLAVLCLLALVLPEPSPAP